MNNQSFEIIANKVIMRIHDKVCESEQEILASPLFKEILKRAVEDLVLRNSHLLDVFEKRRVNDQAIDTLISCIKHLAVPEQGKEIFRGGSLSRGAKSGGGPGVCP